MENPTSHLGQLAGSSKRLVTRLLTISENRLELLMVELQEERERIVRVILLALGTAVFGLLAGVALTVAIVILFWERSPLIAMLVLAVFYAACGAFLYAALAKLLRDWETLPETLAQLRKDRECLERNLN